MRNLVAACVAITVFGFAFGMTYPLLSLLLEQQNVSTRMIGLNAAMMPIGILLFSSVIPVATRIMGAKRLAIGASLLSALFVLGYKVFPSIDSWFVLRLLQGMTISTLFVLSESWIIGCTTEENRGRVVAIYASVLSFSFAMGPAVVSVTGIEGWFPFVVGSLVLLFGTIPLLFIVEEADAVPDETLTSGVIAFVPKAPMLLASVCAFAIFDAATLSLLPIFAIRHGLSLPIATLLLTALIIGNVILQYPIGMLADRYPKRSVLRACAMFTAICLALLPMAMNTPFMWLLVIAAGATGYGTYTVALAALGDRFTGQELIDGTSAFASMWGVGALIGALLGGWAMTGFGPNGLPMMLAVVFVLLYAGLWTRQREVGARP